MAICKKILWKSPAAFCRVTESRFDLHFFKLKIILLLKLGFCFLFLFFKVEILRPRFYYFYLNEN